MSKYVRGVKRNQIIQRWIQGIEDPDYEVFPTKKEGKYIVKLRECQLNDACERSSVCESSKINMALNEPQESNELNERSSVYESNESEEEKEEIKRQQTRSKQPLHNERSVKIRSATTDSTINLEILEQLRSLGEEIRNDRFKKEQKQYIKHIVNKELNKPRIRSKYVPEMFLEPDNDDKNVKEEIKEEVYQQEVPSELMTQQPVFKSCIRR